jgi:GWxTD domain-containing protein
MHPGSTRLLRLTLVAALAAAGITGCAGGRPEPGRGGPAAPSPQVGTSDLALDPLPVYREAGLIAVSGSLPFVGSVHYLAGSSPDSTLVLLSLSLANRALTFSTERSTPRAAYSVVVDVQRGDTAGQPIVRHLEAHEVVRVASLKETTRRDPGIVFQKAIALAPGQYTLTVSLRDDGSDRHGSSDLGMSVPRFPGTVLAPPIAVYQASVRSNSRVMPMLIANPRATALFGRDSVMRIYVEGYDLTPGTRVALAVRSADSLMLWRDTLAMRGDSALQAGTISIPVAQLGVGEFMVDATPVGGSGAVQAPLFVSFLENGAIATFDEMVSYLRYFATSEQLQTLRDAVPAARAAAWTAFWHATDPMPSTPEHEGIEQYFARLRDANARFDDEGVAGWLTDRGKVLITLGEPDEMMEPRLSAMEEQGSFETWVYDQYHIQLIFINRTGLGGRWLLTPSSEAAFERAAEVERER